MLVVLLLLPLVAGFVFILVGVANAARSASERLRGWGPNANPQAPAPSRFRKVVAWGLMGAYYVCLAAAFCLAGYALLMLLLGAFAS